MPGGQFILHYRRDTIGSPSTKGCETIILLVKSAPMPSDPHPVGPALHPMLRYPNRTMTRRQQPMPGFPYPGPLPDPMSRRPNMPWAGLNPDDNFLSRRRRGLTHDDFPSEGRAADDDSGLSLYQGGQGAHEKGTCKKRQYDATRRNHCELLVRMITRSYTRSVLPLSTIPQLQICNWCRLPGSDERCPVITTDFRMRARYDGRERAI